MIKGTVGDEKSEEEGKSVDLCGGRRTQKEKQERHY